MASKVRPSPALHRKVGVLGSNSTLCFTWNNNQKGADWGLQATVRWFFLHPSPVSETHYKRPMWLTVLLPVTRVRPLYLVLKIQVSSQDGIPAQEKASLGGSDGKQNQNGFPGLGGFL